MRLSKVYLRFMNYFSLRFLEGIAMFSFRFLGSGSGIGGGLFAVYYDAKTDTVTN